MFDGDAQALAQLQAPAKPATSSEAPENPYDLWCVCVLGKSFRESVRSKHASLVEANKAAKRVWGEYSGLDMVDVQCNVEGLPYSAFACYGMGQGSTTVFVRPAHANDLDVAQLRAACARRGIKGGTKTAMKSALAMADSTPSDSTRAAAKKRERVD